MSTANEMHGRMLKDDTYSSRLMTLRLLNNSALISEVFLASVGTNAFKVLAAKNMSSLGSVH